MVVSDQFGRGSAFGSAELGAGSNISYCIYGIYVYKKKKKKKKN